MGKIGAVTVAQDIVSGCFKGFAMLRQMAHQAPMGQDGSLQSPTPMPMYIEG